VRGALVLRTGTAGEARASLLDFHQHGRGSALVDFKSHRNSPFVLPVNAPQNMIAYGTDTFEARDFIRTGLAITLVAMLLLVVFAMTYWPWMGYMTRSI
jgi:hypothetical protein